MNHQDKVLIHETYSISSGFASEYGAATQECDAEQKTKKHDHCLRAALHCEPLIWGL